MIVAGAALAVCAVAPDALAAPRRCATASIKVQAGGSSLITLSCRSGKKLVSGRRALATRPVHGRLTSFDGRRVRYRPNAGFTGRDALTFKLGRWTGKVAILVIAAPKPPAPAAPAFAPPAPLPATAPAPAPKTDELPPPLPPAPPSIAFAARNWTPAPQDTCPRALHERYSVIGPDGKVYPTWHPAVVTDPATGQPCTFGHEHGRDPRGSDIYAWVARHLAAPGKEAYAGIPFGAATEALEDYPGAAARSEDHVGYKIDYENDVPLSTASGRIGVTCDYLVRVHQGTHSPDALTNNVHELLYASRCTDGTEIISNLVGRFGAPGEYTRGCDAATAIATAPSPYPAGPGARLIPDRTCMLSGFLVPPGRMSSVWAAYELWRAHTALTTAQDRTIAAYDTGFGVFNPSRYADGATTRRTVDLCGEVEAGGDRANSPLCDGGAFDGTQRDTYLAGTTIANAGGPRLWWTDPYGGHASPQPFPGGICQLVSPIDTPDRAGVQPQVFGRNRSNGAPGVHSPN
jgi:hypothetical protein